MSGPSWARIGTLMLVCKTWKELGTATSVFIDRAVIGLAF